MINILIIFYISLINNYLLINYNNKEYKLMLKSENKLLLKSNITNNIEKENNYTLKEENKLVKQRNKFCNFQCNCFFSHTVKSDNINIQKSDWMIHYGLS